MKLSEIMNLNCVKSRIGFDSDNNMVINEEKGKVNGGFTIFELNAERYETILEICKGVKENEGLLFLFKLIPIITDLEVDIDYEMFEFKINEGNALVLEFIGLIADAYKDIDKMRKSQAALDSTINGLNKFNKELSKVTKK